MGNPGPLDEAAIRKIVKEIVDDAIIQMREEIVTARRAVATDIQSVKNEIAEIRQHIS